MLKKITNVAAIAVAFLAITLSARPAMAAGWTYRIEARMDGPGALEAKGDYRERMRSGVLVQHFGVEIQGAAADTTYEVRINGNLFGTITTDSLGRGQMEFRTPIDNNPNDEAPLPSEFPHLNAGDTISVGPLSGSFRAR